MNWLHRIRVMFVLLTFTLLLGVHPVSADEGSAQRLNHYPEPAGELIQSSEIATGASTGIEPMSNALISMWGTSIQSVSYRTVIVSAYTRAITPVKYLNVWLYLQKWDGSTWLDVASWLFEQRNSGYVEGYVRVELGNPGYYRTRAVHYADDGFQTEVVTSVSASILTE